jgi:acid phosphatase (class A)
LGNSTNPHKRFYNVLGFEQGESPQLDLLVQRIDAESYHPILYFKHKFSRTRPYQIDNSLTTVIDGPPHASYPSGHATQGYLFSSILSELIEEDDPRVLQLNELGKSMGIRREIAGVHYPSDTKAGVDLAIQLKAWMTGKPDFNEAFLAAKTALNQPKKQ